MLCSLKFSCSISGMLTRPGVSRPRPEIKAKVELNSYGAMAVPMTLVYQCTVSVIILWYTVWKNIGHFDLGLGFERGQGRKHKAKAKSLKAKARSLKAKAKVRKFGLEAKA